MTKRVRFQSPAGIYRSGDTAQFDDNAEADRYIAEGVAILHDGDGDAPAKQPEGIATQSYGPILAQGRVEAHEVNPASTVILDNGGSDKPQPVDKADTTEKAGPQLQPDPAKKPADDPAGKEPSKDVKK